MIDQCYASCRKLRELSNLLPSRLSELMKTFSEFSKKCQIAVPKIRFLIGPCLGISIPKKIYIPVLNSIWYALSEFGWMRWKFYVIEIFYLTGICHKKSCFKGTTLVILIREHARQGKSLIFSSQLAPFYYIKAGRKDNAAYIVACSLIQPARIIGT